MKVLLVEDDEYIAQALSATLTEQHYIVDVGPMTVKRDGNMQRLLPMI